MLLTGTCMIFVGFFVAISESIICLSSGCRHKTLRISTLTVIRVREMTDGAESSTTLESVDAHLSLQIHSEAPGSVSVSDGLQNTAPPFFVLEMSTSKDGLSLVQWTQHWLTNRTLLLHLTPFEIKNYISHGTTRSVWEVPQEMNKHLHVVFMGGLIAVLLLLIIFSVALYGQRHCAKASLEIQYIHSVMLGPSSGDAQSSKLQHITSFFETPFLKDYNYEENGPQGTHFKELEYQRVKCKKSMCLEREKHELTATLGMKGAWKSPLSLTVLVLIGVNLFILTIVSGSKLPCPLSVKVTLHVPEQFIADGSNFVIREGSYLDVSDWMNPAQIYVYYQLNASSSWFGDLCGQRTTNACEQLCNPDTGECSCHEGYSLDPKHHHLCVRRNWGESQGPWPYNTLERGYDLVTGEQAPERILRSTYSLGQGLWLPVSKSFVVPPTDLSINSLASCKTDVFVTEDPADVREEAFQTTQFESVDDLLSSFGPVRDCTLSNGGCLRNFKCISDRKIDSTGCVCPKGLRQMKDGSGCYDYSKGIDCSDGSNGGCEQLCLQQMIPLPEEPSESAIYMFCGCVEEYRLRPDGRSCQMLTDICEGHQCLQLEIRQNNTLFEEMLHGFDNKTQKVNQGRVFHMSFRENNFIKDFPQLADGLLAIPLPVEDQCRGILSEPLPDIQMLTGDVRYNEAMGYPMLQHWRVQSNLYKVKLRSITLSAGFANVLRILSSQSSREELQSVMRLFGTHYISDALYGSELSCTIRFPNKKVQQQLWLQYQKETIELGSKKELKSMPFITYLSGLLTAQILSDDQLITGVEIHCEEKGRCPFSCHLCRRAGKEQISPTPMLLEITQIMPLYSLIQDNATSKVFERAFMSLYWCSGKGEVITDWCRCDINALDENGLPSCSPLPPPVFRLSPNMEPSSTVVALEWMDVQAVIGTKVSDYILHHKKIEELIDTELYTTVESQSLADLMSGLGTGCIAAGRSYLETSDKNLYSVIYKCLEPDSLYKFTLFAVDTHGRNSAQNSVTLRTACPLIDDSKAEEIADRIYTLYNGYTTGKEQQMAYNTLMEVSASMLLRVQHHYNSLYEKFGDFVWRSEDELGPRKAQLLLRRLEKVSTHCSGLLRSTHIQRQIDIMPYLMCRSDILQTSEIVSFSILMDSKVTCEEKVVSMPRNMYGELKG